MSKGKCYKCGRLKCIERYPIWVYNSYTHPKEFAKSEGKAFEGAEEMFDEGAEMTSDLMGEIAGGLAGAGAPGLIAAAGLGGAALLMKLGLILKELTGFKFSKSLAKPKAEPAIGRPKRRRGPIVVKQRKGIGYGPRWMPGTSYRVIMARRRKVSVLEATMWGYAKKWVCLDCYRKLWGDKATPPPGSGQHRQIRRLMDELNASLKDRQIH